jgi:uncharacterized protein YqiB (DUF1249 family)
MKRRRYKVDLAGHMAECDANYARMLKLAPDADALGAVRCFVLPRPQGRRLVVRVTLAEQHRYTSTFRIDFAEAQLAAGAAAADPASVDPAMAEPAGAEALVPVSADADAAAVSAFELPTMTVRLYHDARSAEILDVTGQRQLRGFYDYPNVAMMQPDEKAQQNRFLAEFLGVSLATGVALAQPPRGLFRQRPPRSDVEPNEDGDWLQGLRPGRAIVGDSP